MNTFKKKQIEESVGGDIFNDGGQRNVSNNSEIETGPVAKSFNDYSDYEEGMPPTTDKVFSRYRQDIPWFAVYTFGGSRVGSTASNMEIRENKSRIIKKKSVEEELVKKSIIKDITPKDYDNKIEKIISSIENIDLNGENIKKLKDILDNKEIKDKKNL